MGRRFSEAERTTIWDMREAGVPVKRIAAPPKLPRHSASLTRSFPRLSRPSASRGTGPEASASFGVTHQVVSGAFETFRVSC